MNDPETLLVTAKVGAGVAVFAAVLYLATSRTERRGFHLFPGSADEWAHYWFRTLILGVISAMLIFPSTNAGGGLLALGTVLLFGSSVAFWQTDRGFCIAGLILSAVSILWALLFPQISTVRGA